MNRRRKPKSYTPSSIDEEIPPTINHDNTEEPAVSLSFNLTNHLLIAMPTMLDPVFGGAVIYICEHNASGALGILLNKPVDMTLDILFNRVNHLPIANTQNDLLRQTMANHPVFFGGPVQVERGFVLHSPIKSYTSSLIVTNDIAVTTSKDILEALTKGEGPDKFLVSLGCSGWITGQLEEEIVKNSWLTVPAEPAIIFDIPSQQRFTAALKLLGISPLSLTMESGHA